MLYGFIYLLIGYSGSLKFNLQLLKKRCMIFFVMNAQLLCTVGLLLICQSLVLGLAWDSEMCFVNCKKN